MAPKFLLEETLAQEDGIGPETPVGAQRAKLLVLTLAITHHLERETLQVSVWGSGNRADWGVRPLASFSGKSYCGMYSMLLNLASRPEIQFLRVHWKMSRWDKKNEVPMFGFYVFTEVSGARLSAAA